MRIIFYSCVYTYATPTYAHHSVFIVHIPPPTVHAHNSFQYHDNEEVVLWMNTVGPYHNRQETYTFFSLPYCKGPQKEIGHYHETMAEALQGVELEFSGLEISFKGMHSRPMCGFGEVEILIGSEAVKCNW